jgi:Bacterial SH3 domain
MRWVAALLCVCALGGVAATAHADGNDQDVFARVVVSETELRSGPGVSHRIIYRAHRGETFLVEGREGNGFWLKLVLPDGRIAYVLGDTVEAVSAGQGAPEEARKPGFFAPPALEEAHAGFSLMGGSFDNNGYVEFRPAFVLAPSVTIEPYAGLSLRSDARSFIYGLGATLNLAPDWAVAPYVLLGAGGVHTQPGGQFVNIESSSMFHARAGGGLLVSLRWRILLRIEASNTILFTEDSYRNAQAYIGGLGTYF